MPANINPVYPVTPNVPVMTGGSITAANTGLDGSGTLILIFTAGANGSRIDRIRANAQGTNTASRASVFVNNGSATGSTTTTLYGDFSLPGTTLSQVASFSQNIDYIMDLPLPAAWRVYVCIGTAVAAGWLFLGIGGDY